ncbi:hypothetical protein SynROS8604_01671 [Synechococcus sp. ROS8604]|nr:hypothetical protein SynROS8604_01671 [Synechococcus sp. ROS8604]
MPVSDETESQIHGVPFLKPLRSFQAAALGSWCLRSKHLNRSPMKWRTIKKLDRSLTCPVRHHAALWA